MFRKAFIFILFCIASPAWLLLRSRYGGQFLRYLFISWAVIASIAIALRTLALQGMNNGQPLVAIEQWAIGAGIIYPLSGVLWGVQAILLILHRLAIRTRDSAPPQPWYTGAFPLTLGTPRLIDNFAIMAGGLAAWANWFAPDGSFERGLAFTLIVILVAFAILSHSLRHNDNTLPYAVSTAKAPRPEKRSSR